MKILTYGTFDLFHIGHLNLLRRSKALGNHLTVAISTDDFNLKSKNKVCAQPYYERAEIVGSIKYVDEVIAETNWDQKIKDVVENNIDVFVIGDDWEGKFDFLKEYCEVVYLPRTEGVSTTERKNEIISKFS
ncbi:glycerol-3-phosphate cytidylyltransferase [Shewanella electrodiphila]|uniref:Glycerol-3-phosphate cytidylyltransferase n=1 Tax=Shewanella electrodiphila TaxID=934143 RepID=A0ABT0KJW6_9GAMM|nr:glycerol-3-phosphate cytidylyltransferase [Shewanella electrodiphila]MCL1044131.1 glycerol-3-phosphate cytidylyltransferase [Shewanella electrodiphila]